MPVCMSAQPTNRLPAIVDGTRISRVNVCGAVSRWGVESWLFVPLKMVDPSSSLVQAFGLGWVGLPTVVAGWVLL